MMRYSTTHSTKRIITAIITLLLTLPLTSHATTNTDGFDWEPVIKAIAHIESRGNASARNGSYVGLLQISPILVTECNNILKSQGSSKRYTLADRTNAQKSKEMFVIIQKHHNPTNNIERAIRLWKGGIAYSIKKTQSYFNRVMQLL